jgi:hypothetical protein
VGGVYPPTVPSPSPSEPQPGRHKTPPHRSRGTTCKSLRRRGVAGAVHAGITASVGGSRLRYGRSLGLRTCKASVPPCGLFLNPLRGRTTAHQGGEKASQSRPSQRRSRGRRRPPMSAGTRRNTEASRRLLGCIGTDIQLADRSVPGRHLQCSNYQRSASSRVGDGPLASSPRNAFQNGSPSALSRLNGSRRTVRWRPAPWRAGECVVVVDHPGHAQRNTTRQVWSHRCGLTALDLRRTGGREEENGKLRPVRFCG